MKDIIKQFSLFTLFIHQVKHLGVSQWQVENLSSRSRGSFRQQNEWR